MFKTPSAGHDHGRKPILSFTYMEVHVHPKQYESFPPCHIYVSEQGDHENGWFILWFSFEPEMVDKAPNKKNRSDVHPLDAPALGDAAWVPLL